MIVNLDNLQLCIIITFVNSSFKQVIYIYLHFECLFIFNNKILLILYFLEEF